MRPSKINTIRGVLLVLTAALFVIGIIIINNIDKVPLTGTYGRNFEKAEVVKVIKDNLAEDGNRYGDQTVKVRITSGQSKGKTMTATSPGGNLFGATCRVGSKVIVILSENNDNIQATVYSKDRTLAVYLYGLFFLLLLALVGGKKGIKAALGLIFAIANIFLILLPLIYRGISPVLAAIIISVFITCFTLFIVNGINVKSLSAVLGTILGVITAGVFACMFGVVAGIDGYNVSDIESLLYVAQNTDINAGNLLFAGIIISSLGAVMDIAMDISSAVNEIHQRIPTISRKELFESGMNIGRDTMGTMSNTLILAFVGGSLSALVLNYAYNLPYLQIINSYNIGIEIMQGLSGSIGIIVTVPFVACISSFLAKRKN